MHLLQCSFWVYRLSITLTSRLVLNLREQDSAHTGLPILVGTEWGFHATSQAVGPIIFRGGTTSDQVGTSTPGMDQSSVADTNVCRANIHRYETGISFVTMLVLTHIMILVTNAHNRSYQRKKYVGYTLYGTILWASTRN
jgi:hypothetical protein